MDRNHSFVISLTYHWKECPYSPDDVGKSIGNRLEDDYGITTFFGDGYIEQITVMKNQASDGKDTTIVSVRCRIY